jgi:hypothetical protein
MNSSRHSPGFANPLLLYTIGGLAFTGSLGLGTVWAQHEISVLANENKALAAQIEKVQRESAEVSAQIEAEEDPTVLLEKDAAWKLGLVPPVEGQLRHETEDPVRHLSAKRNLDLVIPAQPRAEAAGLRSTPTRQANAALPVQRFALAP